MLWSSSSPSFTDLGVCTAVLSHSPTPLSCCRLLHSCPPFLVLLSQSWHWLPWEQWKLQGASHRSHPHITSAAKVCHRNPAHTHCVLSYYLKLRKFIPSRLWQIFAIKFSDNSICVEATGFFFVCIIQSCASDINSIHYMFILAYIGCDIQYSTYKT